MEDVFIRPPSPLADVDIDHLTDHSGGFINSDEEYMLKYIRDISWKNTDAKGMFMEAVAMFGLPSTLSPQTGGSACWFGHVLENTVFHYIEVKDDPVITLFPKKAVCYWKVGIKYDMQKECRNKVFDMGDSLSYDYQKKVLSCRSKNHIWCCVILLIATSVGSCFVTPETVMKNNLVENAITDVERDPSKLRSVISKLSGVLERSPGSVIVYERV